MFRMGVSDEQEPLEGRHHPLAGASDPDPASDQRRVELRAAVTGCDRKIDTYPS